MQVQEFCCPFSHNYELSGYEKIRLALSMSSGRKIDMNVQDFRCCIGKGKYVVVITSIVGTNRLELAGGSFHALLSMCNNHFAVNLVS